MQLRIREHVIRSLRSFQKIGITPHYAVKWEGVSQFDFHVLVWIASRQAGRHASQRFYIHDLLGVTHRHQFIAACAAPKGNEQWPKTVRKSLTMPKEETALSSYGQVAHQNAVLCSIAQL
jgi:hypothetical protein